MGSEIPKSCFVGSQDFKTEFSESAPMTSPVCTGESYDPEDMQCQSCPARNRCPVESTTSAEQVLDELPKMTSTDLLLIAHDEWKRREERKHNHEESGWVAGWINGFMTSKKWALEKLKELRTEREWE